MHLAVDPEPSASLSYCPSRIESSVLSPRRRIAVHEPPTFFGLAVTLSGHDGDDAKGYQERDVKLAVARASRTHEARTGGEHGSRHDLA